MSKLKLVHKKIMNNKTKNINKNTMKMLIQILIKNYKRKIRLKKINQLKINLSHQIKMYNFLQMVYQI